MRNLARVRAPFGLATIVTLCLVFSVVVLTQLTSAAIAGCPMFPTDNVWNARVDTLPVDAQSNAYVASIGANAGAHPDFGTVYQGQPNGIAYTTVLGAQPLVNINYTDYGNQSDAGPFPIPPNAPVEAGSDRHVLVIDTTNCKLYELFNASRQPDNSWNASSGAMYTLTVNGPLRPAGWTSADAAGLPMLPGLARYDEVASGVITHALRFTVPATQKKYVWPARHYASASTNPNLPPMGQRFRLKASFVINPAWSPQVKVILTALKQYGMFVADNSGGGAWFISGAPNPNWDDDSLVNQLKLVKGSDFEAVDESGLMLDPNSGQVRILNLSPALWLPLIKR